MCAGALSTRGAWAALSSLRAEDVIGLDGLCAALPWTDTQLCLFAWRKVAGEAIILAVLNGGVHDDGRHLHRPYLVGTMRPCATQAL